MQRKMTLLITGVLTLLAGTAQSSGWSPADMPWNGKGNAPWSRDNMPWGGHRTWSWSGRRMPWEGRRGGWKGNRGWDDWAPWRKGRKLPWNSGDWKPMPWSNRDRRWRGYPPAGYSRPPALKPPRRRMMVPPGANTGNMLPPGLLPPMGPAVPRPMGPPAGRGISR